jgi:hypothetical protein
VSAGTAGERADAKFSAVTHISRTEHLPTLAHSTQLANSYLLTKDIEEIHSRYSGPSLRISPLRIETNPLAYLEDVTVTGTVWLWLKLPAVAVMVSE